MADAFLTNGRELGERLHATSRNPAEALALAYLRWGTTCAEHVAGDFAFAILDPERGRLFCARDPFGVRPFYYALVGGDFAFASDIATLLDAGVGEDSLNWNRAADYAAGYVFDATSTFHSNLHRLAPGHRLVFDGSGVVVEPWWTVERLAADVGQDCPSELRRRLEAAIARRLEDAERPGAFLSGGLDSSSIVCLATAGRPLAAPLATITQVYDRTPDLNERGYAERVQERSGSHATYVAADTTGAFDDLRDMVWEQHEPVLAPNLGISRLTYRVAADLGLDVVLDGHGGDEVVSHGTGRILDLARSWQLENLWREAKAFANAEASPAWPVFWSWLKAYTPLSKLRRPRAVARSLLRTAPTHSEFRPGLCRYVAEDLARQTRVGERYRTFRRLPTSEHDMHRMGLTDPLLAHASEVLARTAASAGVEVRYPFYDPDVVAYCLSLPAREKLDGGWTRLVLRRAMEGILPPDIQWRRDKLNFMPHAVNSLRRSDEIVKAVVLDNVWGIDDAFDLSALKLAYSRIEQHHEDVAFDAQAIWRAVFYGAWRHYVLTSRRNARR